MNGCRTGQAKITKGYRLPARHVIHTVGPIWHGGGYNERELLSSCYRSCLDLAATYRAESIAFPIISAGAYGYPKDEAMEVAVEEISRFLLHHEMMVYLVVFGRQDFFTGSKLFQDIREYIDDNYVDLHVHQRIENAREAMWHRDEQQALEMDMSLMDGAAGPFRDDDFETAPKAGIPEIKPAFAHPAQKAASEIDWERLASQTDEGFSEALLRLIDEKGMTDAQCNKKANVDRRLFSKIRSDPAYRPSKPTVFAFAIALELTLPETREFLQKAGFAITHSNKMDLVLEYCINNRFYDVISINEILFDLDLPLLGNSNNVA